eukprot:SAG22_NODE_3698_length_1570_cov_0.910265_2_plen_179_part_01
MSGSSGWRGALLPRPSFLLTPALLSVCFRSALVWDSFDFCYRTLQRFAEAEVYERKLAGSPACQADSDGCYPSVVARVILRLRRVGKRAEASAFFEQATARLGADGGRLLGWESEWQLPSWYIAGVVTRPWWEAGQFEAARVLEANFAAIKQEFEQLLGLERQLLADTLAAKGGQDDGA